MKEKSILISISDPWDVGEATGWQGIKGKLLRTDKSAQGEIGLVELSTAIRHEKNLFTHLAAMPRSPADELVDIGGGREIACNFIGLGAPLGQRELRDAVRAWRGGLSFVGDITVRDDV